jgi:RND family efflux transporter MFP subunit
VALLLAALPCLSSAATPSAPAPARVRLIRTAAGEDGRWVAASLQAAKRATVATRLSAVVREVHVEEGQRVAAGQLLVSLGDADLRGQLSAAESGLSAAAAYERRVRALASERAATPSELESATAQRAQAEAAVTAVRANLQYTELRAPFAGVVQARRTDPGDLVGPGQPLLTLEGAGLELGASLSEDEAQGLATGQRIAFRAGDVSGEAEVTALTPGGDPLSHRRGLRARVVGTPPLRSGSFARLRVPGARQARAEDKTWVPRSALVERSDLTGVFVAAGGRAELRWIALGEAIGDRVPVTAGLHPEDQVVDAPAGLSDGQAIEVVP